MSHTRFLLIIVPQLTDNINAHLSLSTCIVATIDSMDQVLLNDHGNMADSRLLPNVCIAVNTIGSGHYHQWALGSIQFSRGN